MNMSVVSWVSWRPFAVVQSASLHESLLEARDRANQRQKQAGSLLHKKLTQKRMYAGAAVVTMLEYRYATPALFRFGQLS